MNRTDLPRGWDAGRLGRLAATYDDQTEDEAVREDEDAFRPGRSEESGVGTRNGVVVVPSELLPAIRELIARHNSGRNC